MVLSFFLEIQCTRKYIPNTELLNEKDKYRFKETAYYKCTDGYKGQFSLYCGRHGEWSGNSECDGKYEKLFFL